MSDLQWWGIIFLAAGIFFLVSAISAKRGSLKFMFMKKPNLETPVDGIYAALPLGVGCILLGIAGFMRGTPISRPSAILGIGGAIIFSFIFMAWKPRWLKPAWLLWLEEKYNERMLNFMFDQARKEGRTWSKRVATQEGLEGWAEEIVQKYHRELK